ncbi:polyamine ABC transporter substrate-binding protein [Neisseria leonii]|uniref:polyamine ABC transporter substrate-binding protein n=1 Tax=Neisseria leonii TaxID=2995413 RepID=UPI0030D4B485
MLKKLFLLGAAVFSLAACGGKSEQPPNTSSPASAASEAVSGLPETAAVKVYNWSDYVDPQTLRGFEQKTGVKLTYDIYDSDETLEAKVLTGKSGYDVVAPSNAFVGRQIKVGAYQKINKELIPNLKHISPKLLQLMQQVDPGNEYAVPFFWGSNTLAVNTERVEKALNGLPMPENLWALVFDPQYTAKLKSCGISYLDSAAEIYPLVLNYLGKNPNSSDQADIDAATALLKANRPNIKRFTSSGYIDDLARGDTCATIGFSGELNVAKRRAQEAGRGENIEVLIPKEGVGIWVDSFAIPADAANVRNAHRFINDFLDPEVAAVNGNYVSYSPSSMPARDLMDESLRNDPTVFLSEEDLANSFIMTPLDPARLRDMVREWQRIKAGG